MYRFLASALLYSVLSVIPLFVKTGRNLEYEYSLLLAFLYLLTLPILSIVSAKSDASFFIDLGEMSSRIKNFVTSLAPALLVPLAIASFLFWSEISVCGRQEFLCWFLINTVPAIFISFMVSLVIHRLKIIGYGRIRLLVFFGAFLSLSGIDLVTRLWLFPQKRISHFFFGFLHGPIYDSWIALDWGIVFSRCSHLALAMAVIYPLLTQSRTYYRRSFAAMFLLAYFLLQFFASAYPSAGHGLDVLDRHLPTRLEGQGYTLHYAQGKTKESDDHTAHALAREIEFHLQELNVPLHLTDAPHVHVYAYPNSDLKKLAFGGGRTDITDVVTPSIHILMTVHPHPNLRHELVHALSSQFAYHGLGFHPNMALTEGLAVALAPSPDAITLDAAAHSLIISERVGDLSLLLSPFFWLKSGARAYVLAGSLVRHILSEHGSAVLSGIYAGQPLESLTQGQTMNDLVSSWKKHLSAQSVSRENDVLSERLFRAPSILGQQCPHTKAVKKRRADPSILLSGRRPQNWPRVVDRLNLVRETFGDIPAEQVSRMSRLIFRQARKLGENRGRGDASALPQMLLEEHAGILSQIDKLTRMASKYYESFELRLLRSDLLMLVDETKSREELSILQKDLKGFDLGASFERKVFARIEIMKLQHKNERSHWRSYLAGWGRLPNFSLEKGPRFNSSWMLQYLSLRRKRYSDKYTVDKLAELLTQRPVPSGLPDSFRVEWNRLLAESFMRKQAFKEAAIAYEKCAVSARPGAQDWYRGLVRMAHFFQEERDEEEKTSSGTTHH